MTPEEFKTIRYLLGLGIVAFGRALGCKGRENTISVYVRRMESGRRPVPVTVATRARALLGREQPRPQP